MGGSRQLSVELPEEALKYVREQVASGEYASESDVVRQGLEALRQEAAGRAQWEREVIVSARKRYMADPRSGVPLEEVKQRLEVRRRERLNPK